MLCAKQQQQQQQQKMKTLNQCELIPVISKQKANSIFEETSVTGSLGPADIHECRWRHKRFTKWKRGSTKSSLQVAHLLGAISCACV